MRCKRCGCTKLYTLNDGRLKCSSCHVRFSPAKLAKEGALIEVFSRDQSALSASQKTKISYATVLSAYDTFRHRIATQSEAEFPNRTITQYDEYIYATSANLLNGQDFLTFDCDGVIYTLLMGFDKYKSKIETVEDYEEFVKFIKYNRVSKLKSHDNIIVEFWHFFEEFMKRFKGVSGEKFYFYLKEAEWRFNHPEPTERIAWLNATK